MSNLALDLSSERIYNDEKVRWCSVSLKEVFEKKMRLEAQVYDIEARNARLVIQNCKDSYVYLGGESGLIKKASYPGRFKRIYCSSENGVPFYLPSQMNDIYPKPDKYISGITNCNINELKLQRGTLLLTRSGTIGSTTIVSKTLEGKVFSDDVIRISFKDDIDIGFIYAYLKTDIGRIILRTNGYGSVITHIEPEHLDKLMVPNIPRRLKIEINELIKKSFELRDKSNELLHNADELLKDSLGIPSLNDIKRTLTTSLGGHYIFSTKLSNVNYRLEASYHTPMVNEICKLLSKNAKCVTSLADKSIVKDIILPTRFKRVYVEKEYGRVFIGGKQIGELDPEDKKYLSINKHAKIITNQLELKENMILITCSGTIGKVVMVPKHWNNWTANQHIIRVVPNSNDIAGYLSVYLASDIGSELVKRFKYGSVVDEINDTHVSQIVVPLLKDEEIQQRINSYALDANEQRYEAYVLEQKAINILNNYLS